MTILTFDIEEWFHLLDHPSTRTEDDWAKFPSRIHENVDRILEMLSAPWRMTFTLPVVVTSPLSS